MQIEPIRVAGEISEDDALAALGGRRLPAEDAVERVPPRPPIFGNSDHWAALEARMPTSLPATRVLELPGARVLGAVGWVGVGDRVVTSVSWWESTPGHPRLRQLEYDRERRLEGTVLNLATMNGWANYSHFLLDGLGRVSVAELAGVRLDDVEWVIVPGLSTDGARRKLAAAGIPRRKRVRLRKGVVVTADVVLAPSMPGTSRVYRPSLPRYLRTLMKPGMRTGRRIYVTRPDAGRRPLTNRPAMERVLAAYGFRAVDPMQVNLARLMTTADVVVGEHGAALADLAFCRPGTHVVELIPSDHMHPYYFSLANAAELNYSAVITRSVEHRAPDAWYPSPHSVEVPLGALADALDALPG